MRILLLKPATNWQHPYAESPSIALLTLGAIAKQYGHQVKVYYLDIDDIDIAHKVETYHPDIVGITVNTFEVRSAREIVKAIGNKARVIIGGPHAVAWTEQDGKAEVVKGEGENKWLEVLGVKERYTNDIDSFPLPDYSLVDMSRFSGTEPLGASPSMVLFCSRGCPGKCTFCNTPIHWGNLPRYRQPESIVDEIAMLNRDYGIQEIFLQDDTLNINREWAEEIFERIIAQGLHKDLVFKIACRANEKMLTEKFLNLAAKAGVWNIFLGIESGSQMMLDRMQKHITVEENRRAIRLVQQYGIKVQASFIVGLPGETWGTILETHRFISETHPDILGYGFATPFPGTEFDRYVTEHNQKLPIDYADYIYGRPIVRTDELSYEDLASFKGYLNLQRVEVTA